MLPSPDGSLVNLSEFPNIELAFLLKQDNAFIATELTDLDLELYEDGHGITIENMPLKPEQKPMTFVVIFDVPDLTFSSVVVDNPEIPDHEFEDLMNEIKTTNHPDDLWILCSTQMEQVCSDKRTTPVDANYDSLRWELLGSRDQTIDLSLVLRTAIAETKLLDPIFIIIKKHPNFEAPYVSDPLMTELLLIGTPLIVVNLAHQNDQNDNPQFLIDMRSRVGESGGEYFCNRNNTGCQYWGNRLGMLLARNRPHQFTLFYQSHLFRDSTNHQVLLVYHDSNHSLNEQTDFRFLVTDSRNLPESGLKSWVRKLDPVLSVILLVLCFIIIVRSVPD